MSWLRRIICCGLLGVHRFVIVRENVAGVERVCLRCGTREWTVYPISQGLDRR